MHLTSPKLIAAVVSLLATASLSAQFYARADNLVPLGTHVERGSKTAYKALKKGSTVTYSCVTWRGFRSTAAVSERIGCCQSVHANEVRFGGGCTGRAATAGINHIYYMNHTAPAAVRMYSSTSPDGKNVKPGVHVIRYVLPYLPGFKVPITFSCSLPGKYITAKVAEVDIGGDGTAEWKCPLTPGSYSKTITATAGTNGIVVVLRLHTEANFPKGTYNFWRGLWVGLGFTWKPGQRKCSLLGRGTSCGPKLTATLAPNFQTVDLAVTGGAPTRIGILVIGSRPTAIKFPGTNCFLYSTLDLFLPHPYDASGNARFRFGVPTTWFGRAEFQDLSLAIRSGKLDIQSTNAYELDCGVR